MHSFSFLIGFLILIIRESSASYSQGGSNGNSQMEGEEASELVQTPVMYSAPLMAAVPTVPLSPVVHYGMNSPRSEVRNLVGSYAREEGHLSDTMLELPFRRARARKLAARKAARMRKNLKRHRKVNMQ